MVLKHHVDGRDRLDPGRPGKIIAAPFPLTIYTLLLAVLLGSSLIRRGAAPGRPLVRAGHAPRCPAPLEAKGTDAYPPCSDATRPSARAVSSCTRITSSRCGVDASYISTSVNASSR